MIQVSIMKIFMSEISERLNLLFYHPSDGVISVLSVNCHPSDGVISVLILFYRPTDGVISVLSVNYHPSDGVISV